ncbi:ThiF family adenylyltransferase [Metabacillus sp. FJAT-52054]|uniref:ThiF family adenylyltransferase n=1 Tax=Metabacillus sediminis TaxID=3117746 RepID=A0ABZ2NFS1_9BACI
MNPAIKKTLLPIIQKEGCIEITLNYVATDIEDPDGGIYQLCRLLDGDHSIDEISSKLSLSKEEVADAIESLNSLGFVEYEYQPPHYTKTELERYRSNLNYFSGFSSLDVSKYEIQNRLRDKKAVVLGLGGGSLAASFLAGMGIGEIVGVDFDIVERSNLNRQCLYNEEDIGRLKTDAAREKVLKINPEISMTVHDLEISSYMDLLPILEGADVVINMIDQPAISSLRWVSAACIKLNIPYYSGGVNHQIVQLDRVIPANGDPCYDCMLIHTMSLHRDSVYRLKESYGKIFSNVNTGFGPNVSLLTGLMMTDAAKLLTGISPVSKPMLTMDLSDLTLEQSEFGTGRLACCPTCSGSFEQLASFEELQKLAERELTEA